MTSVEPQEGKIVVQKSDEDNLHETPDPKEESPIVGIVVAIGGGKTLENEFGEEIKLMIADKVLFWEHAANWIEMDGAKVLLLAVTDILQYLGA